MANWHNCVKIYLSVFVCRHENISIAKGEELIRGVLVTITPFLGLATLEVTNP
jgi:hypothetical protein